ncbi:MAG: hypothetical protein L0287_23545, partial [Anaerolineae bacterium]|nr:hypothetical protein [Anaerolineae bacterium]
DNVPIPQNANILSAVIEFMVDGRYEVPVAVDIFVEASGNSLPFSASNRPENRPLTQVHTVWDIPNDDIWNLGEIHETPNFHFIIQEIVRRQDWNQENAISIILKNHSSTNVRRVIAIDRALWDTSLSPAVLAITYDLNSVPTVTPPPVTTSTPVPATSTPTPTATVPIPQPTVCTVTCWWETCTSASQPSSGKLAKLSWKISQLDRIAEQAALLYRVRDEILESSSQGQHYIDLYYSHSAEIATIMNTHPELAEQGMDFIDLMTPNLQALLDGRGDAVEITIEQVQKAEAFLDALIPFASPELQETIAQERQRHPLNQLAGVTMDEAWIYLNGYQIEWLPPVSTADPYNGQRGKTIPLKFSITNFEGNFIVDTTLTLQILDSNGAVVVGPLSVSDNPVNGIAIQGNQYHYNLETKNLPVGAYTVQITYNSVDGVQSVTKTIMLTKQK